MNIVIFLHEIETSQIRITDCTITLFQYRNFKKFLERATAQALCGYITNIALALRISSCERVRFLASGRNHQLT